MSQPHFPINKTHKLPEGSERASERERVNECELFCCHKNFPCAAMHSRMQALSCGCHKTREIERERESERARARGAHFPCQLQHTHRHSVVAKTVTAAAAAAASAAAYGRLALPACRTSLTSLTGAVTAAAATIMESEMDISLMRLHITRSAINQTGGGRSVREGQTETEEREKKKEKRQRENT